MANIGVLALQGAFREHAGKIRELGHNAHEIRQKKDLANLDGIILPGGESTTIGKLLNDLEIFQPLSDMLKNGLPAFGTCAGAIILSKNILGSSQPTFGLLEIDIERNAFGRQTDSFEKDLEIPELGSIPYPAVFIRAPLMANPGKNVKTLAELEINNRKKPVAVRQDNLLAISFHPELTEDNRFHEYFLKMVKKT